MPVTLEDMLREEADTAGAEPHGGWGEAIDIFSMQEVVLKLLFRDGVWRFAVELGEQVYLGVIPQNTWRHVSMPNPAPPRALSASS